MASIAEVSKAAGVSFGTVSNVIHRKSIVADETAKRVLAAMEKVGYCPSPRKRRNGTETMAAQNGLKSGTIGVVFSSDCSYGMLQAPFYARMVHAIDRVLSEHDLGMMVTSVTRKEQLSKISPAQLDGAVVCGYEPWLSDQVKVPMVSVLGHPDPLEEMHLDHVEPANDRIGMLAAQYLMKRGHKQIACINPMIDRHPASDTRINAFMYCAQIGHAEATRFSVPFTERNGLRLLDPDELPVVQHFVSAYQALESKPTGIFVTTDAHLAVLQKAFRRAGIKPGQDVEFIGCNNESLLLDGLDPRPATIDINPEEMAECIFERLIYRIRTQFEGGAPVLINVQPKLVKASSGVKGQW